MVVIVDSADVADGARIGDGSSIWHLAQVREDAVLGENCIVGPRCLRRHRRAAWATTASCRTTRWSTSRRVLEDGVFVGPAVVFTNDHLPARRHARTAR